MSTGNEVKSPDEKRSLLWRNQTERRNGQAAFSKKIMKSLEHKGSFDSLFEIFVAELIGTALLMYFGCMGLFASPIEVKSLPPMQGGLVFGFVVSSIIVVFGHISKAHLNPAVTLCAYLLGSVSIFTAIVYFLAEMIGALLGAYLLQVSSPDNLMTNYAINSTCGFCTTVLAPKLAISQGFLIEFMATAFLMFMVCSVWDPRNAETNDSTALKFGLLVAAISIAAGPFTGASMNPARSFAPALVNQVWNNHWLYWLAPMSGSAVATLLYKYVFMRDISASAAEESSSVDQTMMMKDQIQRKDIQSTDKCSNLV